MDENTEDLIVEIDKDNKQLVLRLPLNVAKKADDLPHSNSKKSRTVATTHGVVRTKVKYLGRELRVGVNAFIPVR